MANGFYHIELLNGVREQIECVIDQVCDGYVLKKPRMYRKRARKDYLNLVKRKKHSTQVIRKAIRKQLQYISMLQRARHSAGRTSIGKATQGADTDETGKSLGCI